MYNVITRYVAAVPLMGSRCACFCHQMRHLWKTARRFRFLLAVSPLSLQRQVLIRHAPSQYIHILTTTRYHIRDTDYRTGVYSRNNRSPRNLSTLLYVSRDISVIPGCSGMHGHWYFPLHLLLSAISNALYTAVRVAMMEKRLIS